LDFADRAAVLQAYRRHVNKGLASLAQMLAAPVEVGSSGPLVFAADGETYLDCGGYGVFILGHCHPKVVEAASAQLARHPVATRLLVNPLLAEAATTLVGCCAENLEYAYFACSGTEVVEAALKLARLAGRRRVIATEGGYHGKTLGALSVTGSRTFRKPFEPLLPDVCHVPFDDVPALEEALASDARPAVFVVEPVQGEGGVRIPADSYLAAARSLTTRYGALLVADEIQTGLGRLGDWWGVDRQGVSPDMLLVGKALGGGVLPVSAVVATAEVFDGLNRDPFIHTSTFAGAPLAMATAVATIGVLREEHIVERAFELGRELASSLVQAADVEGSPVLEVRARGLLIGLDCGDGERAGELVLELLHRRVLISNSLNAASVVRLHPPAVMEEKHVEWLVEALADSCRAVAQRLPSRQDISRHPEQPAGDNRIVEEELTR
jgi:putrescine aminotransferase